ncbi:NACHT domain-containing protein [Kaistella carnis]|uniref:NACHT domain-containing protein n=1 Tax=Kaistella carnis TaxID=1241979 RepID=UPI0028984CCE|nr:NACHT domain-containing protein [Kaistella carnis]
MEPITTSVAITTILSTFKEPILKKFNDLSDEINQIFNNSLNNYVSNYYNKFSHTKTFIYRDEKIDFYEVFYPVTIKSNSKICANSDDLKKIIFEEKFITIIGAAGSGKSMLMKHIFLSCIHQFYTIPIFVELRNLNGSDITILEYISNIITKNRLAKTEKILEKILVEGNFVFLLDGYDEIFSDNKNKITNEIEELVDLYPNNAFVITSRPGANAESLQRFNNYFVQPLDKKQINEFVNKQFNNHENKESIGKIISVIEKPANADYMEYFTNPLLLSMFIFTFGSHPEIPKQKSKFYWNVFDTLCTKHDTFTKKGFWLHERKSKLKNEELEVVLKWFSYISLFKGNYNFDLEYLQETLKAIIEKFKFECEIDNLIYDLTVSISLLIQDGTEYSFPHKSLQEYFTSILIKSLDNDQKEEIYKNKFKLLGHKTIGGNQNFLNLCYEVDKASFLKNFLIPIGEDYLALEKSKDHDVRLKSFFEYFNVRVTIVKNKEDLRFGGHGHRVHSIHVLNEFFNRGLVSSNFNRNIECLNLLKDFLKNKEFVDRGNQDSYFELHLNKNFEEIKAFLICTELINSESDYTNFIRDKISELKKQIEEETISTKELLNY